MANDSLFTMYNIQKECEQTDSIINHIGKIPNGWFLSRLLKKQRALINASISYYKLTHTR